MTTVADLIRAANQGREIERLAIKYDLMAKSKFSFLRGTCGLFYLRLTERKIAPGGPPTWICGDLHLENFGTYLGDNELTYFDLNDFDEAVLAPASWDIVRLATSVLVSAAELQLAQRDAGKLASDLIETWRSELTIGKPRWIERRLAQGVIGDLMDTLRGRRMGKFLDKRSTLKKGVRRLILENGKALCISDSDRAMVTAFAATLEAPHDMPDYFKVIDCARRIAGTGSLGIPRFVILVEGEGSPDDNELLDLKAALPASLAPFSPCKQPKWPNEASRVVAVASRCQAITPSFLRAVEFNGSSYVLRELQPTTDRLNLAEDARNLPAFSDAVHTMGKLAAWAELRATGRDGSATTDELIAYAHTGTAVSAEILEAAHAMAETTEKDWEDYTAAYNEGAFKTAEKAAEQESASKEKRRKRA